MAAPVADAPLFRPSLADFTDPVAYVARVVAPAARAHGLARIVPPPGWSHPEFALNTATLTFPARVQFVSQLGTSAAAARDGAGPRRAFYAAMAA